MPPSPPPPPPAPPPPTRRAALALLAGAAAAAIAPATARAGSAGRASRRGAAAPHEPPDELLRLAGSCVIAGWYGRGFPRELRALLERGALGGVIVNRHNFDGTRADLTGLCARLVALAPRDATPLLAADMEGGPVAHLAPPLVRFPGVPALGALDDLNLTRRVGVAMGEDLRSVGINLDFAPVLDVRTSPRNTVVLGRTFARDPEKVGRHGRALIQGLGSAGVLACAKHFPGHGDTTTDSHAGLPRVAHDLARLEAVELVPFRAVLGTVPSIMLAHVIYRGVDPDNPASLSRRVIEGILRDRLGYAGAAITDDVQMAAIRRLHPGERACEVALRAGVDLVLVAHTSALAARAVRHLALTAERDAALRARLTQASARVAALRGRLRPAIPPNPFPLDGPAIAREVATRHEALTGRRGPRRPERDPTLQR